MSFEDSAGLNVSNHYGPRDTGGTEGNVKTEGVIKEFMQDLDASGLAFGFPVATKNVYVIESDVSQVTGTVSAELIGGVNIAAATPEVPVEILTSNTGIVTLTGATGGKVLIRYKQYAL